MIFQTLKPHFALTSLCFLLAGCITVNLPQENLQPAEKVRFAPPESPFEEIPSTASDKTWKNPKNGNTITYVSECGDVGYVNLKKVARNVLKSNNLKVDSQTEITMNGVRAIQSQGFHENETSTIVVELITFKMKDCLFNLAYLGPKKSFPTDQSIFETFKKKFEGL